VIRPEYYIYSYLNPLYNVPMNYGPKNNQTLFVALGALILGTCIGYAAGAIPGRSSSNHEMGGMEHMMMNMNEELKGKYGDTFDQEFLKEMIVHHQGAIDMAKAALEQSGHPELKELAKNIITAQDAEIAQMRAWQEEWYGGEGE
jgi:predicted outer membrane protein